MSHPNAAAYGICYGIKGDIITRFLLQVIQKKKYGIIRGMFSSNTRQHT